MSDYRAPLRDMFFVLRELVGLDRVLALPGYEEVSADLIEVVLHEAAKFAEGVLAPLNVQGDRQGALYDKSKGEVRMPEGFLAAYRHFVAAGWPTLIHPLTLGGQGLPRLVNASVAEMWKAANHAFSLCPMLNSAAVEVLSAAGSEKLKQSFLEPLIHGRWTATMNLTESQAGSDLSAITAHAEIQAEGHYQLFGQKTFITYGEHDLADNIVHFVLARTPGARSGSKGLSLFLVPKFLVGDQGQLGMRNAVNCLSLEKKLGIHASPTALMAYGNADGVGATAYLVGQEQQGLDLIFMMMNEARLGVALEAIADGERAYQRALAYARQRVQGVEVGGARHERVPIVRHPDVRRMLMMMRVQIEAARALFAMVAAEQDFALHHADPEVAAEHKALVDLLVPVLKGWCAEVGIEVASLGIQVHGGAGFIEETGAAQHWRDVRVTSIYEGTTGIQANDLVLRKLIQDDGRVVQRVLGMMQSLDAELALCRDEEIQAIRCRLESAVSALRHAVDWVIHQRGSSMALAGAVPFLGLFGVVAGGWQLARAALIAQQRIDCGETDSFYRAKRATARFFADHQLTRAEGLAKLVMEGSAATLAFDEAWF